MTLDASHPYAARSDSRTEPRAALLRRYFRAVLGDQAAGDRLAGALWPWVEANTQDVSHAWDQTPVLLAAMRRWRALHHTSAVPAPFSPMAIAKAVSPARALHRQTGILVDVFGLSIAQAAAALDRSEGEVTLLLADARTLARARLGCDVLIVEDDPLVAHHLSQLAQEAGATTVTIAADAEAAMDIAQMRPPALVLCDYDLGQGANGADLVKQLTAAHDCVCVFVTAYPDEAARGCQGEPAFIIGKPFREAVVRAALAYAGSADRPATLAA